MRYEVWCYSRSWRKWIRGVYTSTEAAQKRYERLQRLGRRVKPPQPVNQGLPLFDRVSFFIEDAIERAKSKRQRDPAGKAHEHID